MDDGRKAPDHGRVITVATVTAGRQWACELLRTIVRMGDRNRDEKLSEIAGEALSRLDPHAGRSKGNQ